MIGDTRHRNSAGSHASDRSRQRPSRALNAICSLAAILPEHATAIRSALAHIPVAQPMAWVNKVPAT